MNPVEFHYLKKELRKEIAKRAEHYRTLQNDPHNISTAVYVMLLELDEILKKLKVK